MSTVFTRSVAANTSSSLFEDVSCYYCGSSSSAPFLTAQDDLSGKPGEFTYVSCNDCDLHYQRPRISIDRIKDFYDDEYIAHRKRTDWGLLTRPYEYAMTKHDRDKDKLVSKYVQLGTGSEVLDVGCAVGTFLGHLRRRYGVKATGVDFKDLSSYPSLEDVEFHCGLFSSAPVGERRYDLVTMWHFLEHDYDPMGSLDKARTVLKDDGRLVIEVPRLDSRSFTLYGDRWPGVQAPQHTILFDKEMLLKFVKKKGFEVIDYLPYGAFPAYFYLFAGAAFKLLKGKGLNPYLEKAILPYFLGFAAVSPLLLFEKRLNLAMQTVVCRKA